MTLKPNGTNLYSGKIQGPLSLVFSGTGTQVLAGASTYSGATTINTGTLQLGTGVSGQDGSLATSGIVNNASLVYNIAGTQMTNSYPISGVGSVTKAGAGKVNISSPTYFGATNITSGTLAITNAVPTQAIYEGVVSTTTSPDTTDPIKVTSPQPVARWGASTNSSGTSPVNMNPSPSNPLAWPNSTTLGYTGYIDNTSGTTLTYNFGANFDDFAALIIDGSSAVTNGNNWNSNVEASVNLTPGLHTFDLRFGQGGGGVRPDSARLRQAWAGVQHHWVTRAPTVPGCRSAKATPTRSSTSPQWRGRRLPRW